MKKILIVCCLLLIATSLFAVELKPYKYGYPSFFYMVDENKKTTTILGEPLKSGYISRTRSFILFNLDNAYNELVLTVGVSDDYRTTSPSRIDFYLDGVKVKSVSVNCDSMPEEITVSLNYKRQLKIFTEYYDNSSHDAAVVLTNLDFH